MTNVIIKRAISDEACPTRIYSYLEMYVMCMELTALNGEMYSSSPFPKPDCSAVPC